MWLVNEDLPRTVKVNDKEFAIRTDYRYWIKFENILFDSGIADEYKLYFMTSAVMETPQNMKKELIEALFSFYRLNKPIKRGSSKQSDIGYRYDYDIGLIYAAFYQQYHIDLFQTNLHWWKFKSLFDGLSDQTMFMQVVGYRMADISKMDKEQKKRYTELKKFYALPVDKVQDKSQEELEAKILSKLKRGDADC